MGSKLHQGGLPQFERAHVQPEVSCAGHGNACPDPSTVKSILRQANPLPRKTFIVCYNDINNKPRSVEKPRPDWVVSREFEVVG